MFGHDITKCANEACVKKEQCFRYTAQAELIQSYSLFVPEANGNCEFFIDNKDRKQEGVTQIG